MNKIILFSILLFLCFPLNLQSINAQSGIPNQMQVTLDFSTYLGGSKTDYIYGVAVDSNHNIFVTGFTDSSDFPVINPLNGTGFMSSTSYNGFISVFNSTGSLIMSTYFGDAIIQSVAVDCAGNFYVAGATFSNIPLKNAYNSTFSGIEDAFLAKFNQYGNLVFSTFFGGTGRDYASNVAVDCAGNSYITGLTASTNFPVKGFNNNSYNGGTSDAYLAKFNTTGGLVFSKYLGGSNYDAGSSIALDSYGNIIIGGQTSSSNFPVTSDAFNKTLSGLYNSFISKFNSNGSLIYSTYFGGSGTDSISSIVFNKQNNDLYMTGSTTSHDFPLKNAYNSTYPTYTRYNFGGGAFETGFFAKFDSNNTLKFSTYLGGWAGNQGMGVAVDSLGNCILVGYAISNYFTLKNPNGVTFNSNGQALPAGFISQYDSTGLETSSSLIGGGGNDFVNNLAMDYNSVIVVGTTQSRDLPVKNAYSSEFVGGIQDGFVMKITSETVSAGSSVNSASFKKTTPGFTFIIFLLPVILLALVVNKKKKNNLK